MKERRLSAPARTRGKVFWHMLWSLLVTSIVPVLIFVSLFFWSSTRSAWEEELAWQARSAQSIGDRMDSEFIKLRTVANQLSNTSWVIYRQSTSNVFDDYFTYGMKKRISRELSAYLVQSDWVNRVDVAFIHKSHVATASGWFDFDSYIRFICEDDGEREDFVRRMRNAPSFEFVTMPDGKLILLQRLDMKQRTRTALSIELDPDRMLDAVVGMDARGLSRFEVCFNDEVIFGMGEGGGETSHVISSNIASVSYIIEFETVGWLDMRNTLLWVALGIVLSAALSAIISYRMAAIQYRPINNMMSTLSKDAAGTSEDEYEIIHSSLISYQASSQHMSDTIKRFWRSAKHNVLTQLISGYFEGDAEQLLKEVDIGFDDSKWYCVVMIPPRDDMIAEAVKLAHELCDSARSMGMKAEMVEGIDRNAYVLLCADSPGPIPETSGGVVGEWEQGILGISRSYWRVRTPPADRLQSDYLYPTDWQIQLINKLKIGNSDVALKILDQIERENLARGAGNETMDELHRQIVGDIFRVAHEMNVVMDIPADGTDYPALKRMAGELCDCLSSPGSAQAAANEIVLWVNAHITSPDLSLKALQAKFGLSASSVSRIFKEAVGTNFLDYTNRVRMEMAKEMLTQTDMKVNEVAISVGFGNEYSFRRAFQRLTGMTPSEYVRIYMDGNTREEKRSKQI